MENDDEILEKLSSITDREWKEIVDRLAKWTSFKLKGRILFGAHSEKYLGIDAVNYYVDGAIEKLFTLDWKWQFSKYTIEEQLQRIIGSMMSANVERYKKKPDVVDLIENEELFSLLDNKEIEECADEDYQLFLDALSECVKDDSELELYSVAVLTCNSFDEISRELGYEKPKLYVLQKKLARRVIKYLGIKKGDDYENK